MQRSLKELPEETGNQAGRSRSRRRQDILDKKYSLFYEQSLAEWPFFLEALRGGDGAVIEDFYSIFTIEPLQNLHVVVPRLLKTSLLQFLSFDEINSRPRVPLKNR